MASISASLTHRYDKSVGLTHAEMDDNLDLLGNAATGGQVKGVYYVSSDSSITDHGNSATVGSFANLAANFRSAPYGGEIVFPKGTFTFSSDSLRLFRNLKVRGAGKDATIIQIVGNRPGVVFDILASGTVGALNWSLSDLTIQGSNDGADSGQHGIEFSSSAQYGTVARVNIYQMGGRGLNFPGTGLGAIYNSVRDVEIRNARGYGIYIAGESSQTVFTRVRIVDSYNHGVVFGGTDGTSYSPKSNSFFGGGVEHTANTTDDIYGVWFDNASEYGAYDTLFANFYVEIAGKATGDSAAYWIEAAKGVRIIGGMINFVHWGVVGNSQYSEGIVVEGSTFYQSVSWDGSANLSSTAKIKQGNSAARIHLGAGNTILHTGITWPDVSGVVYGNRNISSTLDSQAAPALIDPYGAIADLPSSSSANRGETYYVRAAAGTADRLLYSIKQADDDYNFVTVGEMWSYNSSFSFAGITVNAGATQTVVQAGVTGAALGRFLRVTPDVDLNGLLLTVQALADSQARLTFYNPTGGNITLAAGTWLYAVATQ